MKFASTVTLFIVVGQATAFSTVSHKNNAKTTSSTQLFMSDKPRVVITGLGVVNGCGVGHESFFQNVIDGKSSLDTVTRFDASKYPCTIASEVPDSIFNPLDFFTNPKNVKSNDRYTHFAVAAARQALQDAGMGDTPETLPDPERIGVMVGSAFGGMETFERETLKLASRPDRPKVSLSHALWSIQVVTYHISSRI
jgi:3-oxoacyl-[acyl-carrier-protein] synthase II